MPEVAAEEIALHGQIGRRMFPLELGRQAAAGPACERVGFVVTDMTDRRMLINFEDTAQGEFRLERLVPVQRPVPATLIHGCPAIRQPEPCISISPRSDEFPILAICDEPVADLMWMH